MVFGVADAGCGPDGDQVRERPGCPAGFLFELTGSGHLGSFAGFDLADGVSQP